MLKVVVFDSGYGGELFADKLEEEFPVLDIIRVIDWRNADAIQNNPRLARQIALAALRPYFERVDLIIFANHLLTITSLRFFRRKFKNQKFLGFNLPSPSTFLERPTVVLTTRSVSKTLNYRNYLFRLKRKVETICLDDWPALIDDGELTDKMVYRAFEEFNREHHYLPAELILACSQFTDIIPLLKSTLGQQTIIHDSFRDAITDVCKILKIRGGVKKHKK